MRRTRVGSIVVTGAFTGQILAPSSKRIGIVFFPAPVTCTYAPGNITPTATVGWSITNAATPFLLTIENIGDVVRSDWTVRIASASTIIFLEIFDDDIK